jgi:hypothetical protein
VRFWAWCNRANPAYPDIWFNFLKAWVDAQCSAGTYLTDPLPSGIQTYYCNDSVGRAWTCSTPIVLVFDPNEPVRFLPASHMFSVSPGSGASSFDWPTPATPWLAFDRNGNGTIDDGSELFGSSTPLQGGSTARNGFEALAEFDSNHDRFIDAADCSWDRLVIWRDGNGDGVSQPAELASVRGERLLGISISYELAPRCDALGNCERERAEFRWVDGSGLLRSGAVIDVYLRSQPDH